MTGGLRRLPKGFPHRFVEVPGGVGILRVPRYIVRIDSTAADGAIKNRGWQVRYARPSAYFADGKGSPRASLRAARDYLAAIWHGPKVVYSPRVTKRRQGPIQEPGVRLVRRLKPTRTVAEYYIEAFGLRRGDPPKRFYIGTENTITQERVAACLSLARQAYAENVARVRASRVY